MLLFLKVFPFVGMVVDFLPIIRFRRNKYFIYFCVAALIDPIHFVLVLFFKINSYMLLPFIGPILLLTLPKREIKQIVFVVFSLILLFPHFGENKIIPLLIATITIAYIIILFCEDLYNEIKNRSFIPVFLPLLILETLRGLINFYLYYENPLLISNLTLVSNTLGTIFMLLIVYWGPGKKIKFSFNKWENEKEYNDEENSKSQNLQLLHFTGRVSTEGLTNMETKVLSLLANGSSNKEIAQNLFVSLRTVYFHINNLKDKLQIDKTSHLIKFAVENRELILKTDKPAQSNSITK